VARIVLGRVAGPFGVKGWLKVTSFTEPPGQILDFPCWRADGPGGSNRELRPIESRPHGKAFVVRLAGVDDRTAAAALGRPELWVERSELPTLAAREHYRADLIGLEVVNLAGERLGRVGHFLDLPENTIMVVVGDRERWLPVGRGQLRRVDLGRGRVTVDWDAEF
jgi:16S rRNA processing protein RimM